MSTIWVKFDSNQIEEDRGKGRKSYEVATNQIREDKQEKAIWFNRLVFELGGCRLIKYDLPGVI